MAINFPNFLGQPIQQQDYSGFQNLLKAGLNRAGYMSDEERVAMERQKLQNALLGHEVQNAPEYNDVRNQYMRAQIQQMMNPSQDRDLTAFQRELSSLYPEGSQEYNDAVRSHLGLNGEGQEEIPEGLPQGSFSYKNLAPYERLVYQKEMVTESKELKGLLKAQRALSDAEQIIKDFPNLSTSVLALLSDPEDRSLIGTLKRKAADPKERAAVEKLDKILNDVVLLQSGSLGERGTDAYRSMVRGIKAQPTLTPEANQYIFDKFKRETAYARPKLQAIQKGLEHQYFVPIDEDIYTDMGSMNQSEKVLKGDEVFLVNGKRYVVPREELEEFRKDMGLNQ